MRAPRLSRAGSARALARWRDLPEGAAPRVCGTVQLGATKGARRRWRGTLETLAFPAEWVRQVDRDEAGALAGMPVAPRRVFRAGHADAAGPPDRNPAGLARRDGAAGAGRARPSGWRAMAALDAAGRELARADTMILANAAGARGVLDASGLLEPWLPRAWRRCTRWPARSRCCRRGAGGRTALHYWRRGLSVARYRRGLRGRQHLYVHGAEQALISGGAAGHVGQGRRLAGRRRSGLECADARQPAGWAGWRAVLPAACPPWGWPMPRTMDGRGLCLARPVLVRAHGRPDRRPPDGRTFAAGAGSGRIGDASMKGDAKGGNSYCDRPLLTGQSRKLRGFAARWARFHRAWQRLRGARTCRAGDRCQLYGPFFV